MPARKTHKITIEVEVDDAIPAHLEKAYKERKRSLVWLTPEDARNMKAPPQGFERPKTPGTVERYAQEIRDGEWLEIINPIMRNSQEEPLNGNHTIAAVIKADKAIAVEMIDGFNNKDMWAVDNNRVRTLGQSATITGKLHDPKGTRLRVAQAMYKSINRPMPMTRQYLLEYTRKHLHGIDFALQQLSSNLESGLRNADIQAVFARAWFTPEFRPLLERAAAFLKLGRPADERYLKRDDALLLMSNIFTTNDIPSANYKLYKIDRPKYRIALNLIHRYLTDETRGLASKASPKVVEAILKKTTHDPFVLPDDTVNKASKGVTVLRMPPGASAARVGS